MQRCVSDMSTDDQMAYAFASTGYIVTSGYLQSAFREEIVAELQGCAPLRDAWHASQTRVSDLPSRGPALAA